MSHAKKLERFGATYHFHHYDQIGRETSVFHAYRPYYLQKLIIQFDDFVYTHNDLDQVEETIFEVCSTTLPALHFALYPALEHLHGPV